jgi:hypothetical protein
MGDVASSMVNNYASGKWGIPIETQNRFPKHPIKEVNGVMKYLSRFPTKIVSYQQAVKFACEYVKVNNKMSNVVVACQTINKSFHLFRTHCTKELI